MRILIVHDAAALGGAEEHTLGLARHLVRAGDEVVVWTTLPAFARRLEATGAQVALIPAAWDFMEADVFPRFVATAPLRRHRFLRALRVERRRGLDAVYLSGMAEKLLVTLPAVALGIPVFWMEFAPLTPLEEIWRGLVLRWYRRLTHLPRRVLSISEHSIDSLVRDGYFDRDRLVLTYTGAEPLDPAALAAADAAGARLRQEVDAGRPVIVSISRLVREKGQDVLVRAMPEVLRRFPGATLLIGGEGPFDRELGALIDQLGLGDAVRLLGYVEDKWALLAAGDVFVFPSVWAAEGFGIVSVEAMMLGKPVVASANGPIPEVVEDGVTGRCVAPGDAAELARALEAVLADEDGRRAMGQAGRRRALERFAFDHVAARTRHVLSGGAGRP